MSKSHRTARIRAAFAIATVMTAGIFTTHAAAKDDCPLLTDEAVAQAFGEPRHAQADASGSCAWILPGGTLNVLVNKQATAKEAGQLYDSFMKEMFKPLTRATQQPRIGSKAFAGMTPPGAQMAQAGVLAVEKDRVLSINFYATGQAPFDESTVSALVGLAQAAMSASPRAQQSYGECEWFTVDQAGKLLGSAGKPRIQRLGVNHCIASDGGTQGVLMVVTDRNVNPKALDNMRQTAERSCTVLPVPELGFDAYAEFGCESPGDKAMSIHLLHKGVHAMVTYNPGAKPAVKADLDRLTPIARRALERLRAM